MIKIKDYIFQEKDIREIWYDSIDKRLRIDCYNRHEYFYIKATFEDIEWNYGTPQETQRQIQKELCKNCYYRDTISNKLKELEEEKRNMMLEITKREEVILDKEKEIAKLEEVNKNLNKIINEFEKFLEEHDATFTLKELRKIKRRRK